MSLFSQLFGVCFGVIEVSKAERYYQTGQDTILYQNTLRREYADRAFNLLNLGVATSVAVVVVFNLRLDDIRFDTPMVLALGIWGVTFISLVVSCISALTPRAQTVPPSLDELRNLVETRMYGEDFVLMSLGDNNREAVRRNYVLLDYLSGAIARAVSALVAMFVSLACILALVFLRNPQSPSCELAGLMG